MPDVYSRLAELDAATQERLAQVLETRGADPAQQEMRTVFLQDIPFPNGARVLEIGCGTGVLVRRLGAWPGVASVVGVDPAPSLIERARQLHDGSPGVRFDVADGVSLPFSEDEFDVVVFDSTLCHMIDPAGGLAEARRVLVPGGIVAAFDGDYATTTVALSEHDPLQACVNATMANSVNDRWLVRRLPALLRDAGLRVLGTRSYGFVDTAGGYMLTVVERGVDFLLSAGQVSAESADALKAEARARVASGRFFGHIAYGSAVAVKP